LEDSSWSSHCGFDVFRAFGMKDGMDLELTKHMGSNDMDFDD